MFVWRLENNPPATCHNDSNIPANHQSCIADSNTNWGRETQNVVAGGDVGFYGYVF
jgi:hypothetical protein